jgi:gluconate 2-dehydrogenase gamma chain
MLMSGEHDESRRAFLIGATVGAAGAVASATIVTEAEAQTKTSARAVDHAMMHGSGGGHGAFLNNDDLATVAAFTERLMPDAPGEPGAKEAGVSNYIDLALSGAYADLQDFYRRGLIALDAYCNATFKESFVYLKPAQQDETITAMETGKATGFSWPSAQAFFNTLRTHTMEGMFADPIYGGNKDFAGWRLVGFPGAQPTFTAADMRSSKAFTGPFVGLQSRAKTPMKRG